MTAAYNLTTLCHKLHEVPLWALAATLLNYCKQLLHTACLRRWAEVAGPKVCLQLLPVLHQHRFLTTDKTVCLIIHWHFCSIFKLPAAPNTPPVPPGQLVPPARIDPQKMATQAEPQKANNGFMGNIDLIPARPHT
jgi:hypothetical protein